jgi:N-succinyldiaminopimelate aminotransferase
VAELRQEVATQLVPELGPDASTFNADDNVLVTNGCQEGIRLSLETCLDPGDTCVVIEPHFDTYVPDARLAGALVTGVPLHHTGDSSAVDPWYLDLDELAQAFEADTPKVFFLNNPHNPTGHVFTDDELSGIAQLCRRHNVIAITDEIYDRIIFSDSPAPFRRLASYPGMANRTLTLSSFSKTGSTTGWKVGWAVGPKHLVNAMTMMSMYTAYAIASPLQYAVADALRAARELDYYTHLSAEYQLRRDLLCGILRDAGYEVCVPGGAYFAMTRHTEPGFNDVSFCYDLIERRGVAAIPASWLTTNSAFPSSFVRWSFCKTEDVLVEARRRLVGPAQGK